RADPAEDLMLWSSEVSLDSLERALLAAGFRGHLREMRVMSRTDSGRVAKLHLSGLTPSEVSGQDLRTAVSATLGLQAVKSTAFEIERTPAGIRFTGRGSGHGVGLCATGSAVLAARGISAEEILATYFPGLTIGPMPAAKVTTDIIVSLPAGSEG